MFKERIIFETELWYVIATLGQITSGYVLIFPKQHTSCLGELSLEQKGGLCSTMFNMAAYLGQEYWGEPELKHCTLFEHGIVGQSVQHAHLHVLPVSLDLTSRVMKDFPQSEIEKLNDLTELLPLRKKRQEPYLLWGSDKSRELMICWNPPAPQQYFRTIVAEILGYPNRADWRTMDPVLDKRMWQKTVERLKERMKYMPFKNENV